MLSLATAWRPSVTAGHNFGAPRSSGVGRRPRPRRQDGASQFPIQQRECKTVLRAEIRMKGWRVGLLPYESL